ncbi:alpha/beta hydrolase [Dermatobacter hominis]|uniref:alpha/beta hydrolase n=1 Tax=Dermatobacter hominis TaxID=2884263 RepID=UPI001D123ABE|nr:alpha/beta fold hydrolase [Dermatobacter hominis]UDY37121.1 alpha/beta fold hydrolase [Dermatobacter hominis]
MADQHPILPGAEPLSVAGGPVGVLVLHGFTGNPSSMRGLAEAFAAAGHTVEMPRLPGHGTHIDDMLATSWADWSAHAEEVLIDLESRTEQVVVAGLSMGGSLTAWLATRHPELSGIICINPAIAPRDDMLAIVSEMVAAGETVMDGIGSDVADPDVEESAYPQTPLAPLVSMFEVANEIVPDLAKIECPLLLFTSPEDHVVPATDSDVLAEAVSGPVERVRCDRSYHVATVDFDKDLIIERSLEFVDRVTG